MTRTIRIKIESISYLVILFSLRSNESSIPASLVQSYQRRSCKSNNFCESLLSYHSFCTSSRLNPSEPACRTLDSKVHPVRPCFPKLRNCHRNKWASESPLTNFRQPFINYPDYTGRSMFLVFVAVLALPYEIIVSYRT